MINGTTSSRRVAPEPVSPSLVSEVAPLDPSLSRSRQNAVSAGSHAARDAGSQAPHDAHTIAGLNVPDPRWDHVGFAEWAWNLGGAPFVPISSLRGLLSSGAAVPTRREAGPEVPFVMHPRIAIGETQLYAVLTAAFGHDDARPSETLAALLRSLSAATCDESDLVFWDHLCLDRSNAIARAGTYRLFTYCRVQTIVLDKGHAGVCTPLASTSRSDPLNHFAGTVSHCAGGTRLNELLEPTACLALASFCQRLVNAKAVETIVSLSQLMHLPRTLDTLRCERCAKLPGLFSLQRPRPTREQLI